MEMPAVTACRVDSCAFNTGGACHALAITVGHASRAGCATFLSADRKGGAGAQTGRVGACKVAECRHNVDFECQADGVVVGVWSHGPADCMTFSAR